MANEKTIVEALYNNFLLRDLFAKIVPGIIVLESVLYNNPFGDGVVTLAERIGWAAVLVLAGLAWLVGFAVQEIGEITRVIRHHPQSYDQSDYRYRRRIAFRGVASESEVQQVERYAVIKEATGNSATAIFLTVGIIAVRHLLPSDNFVASAVLPGFLLIVLAFALLRANRNHANKQYAFIDSVVDRESS
ncbi:MAG: hypothetical protein ACRER2_13605 [Methylococcales bacterium]